MTEDNPYLQGIDWIHSAFIMGSHYAVARIGYQFFGLNIANKYVHLLIASELIHTFTSKSKFEQVFAGIVGVIHSKALSIFMKVPLGEKAFYCGVISNLAYSLMGRASSFAESPVKERVKDLRYLFIYRTVLCGFLTAASLYITGKGCKYLNTDISKRYLIGLMVLNLPLILTWGLFGHLFTDILSQLIAQQIADRLKDSSSPEVQEMYEQIQEMIDWATPDIDLNQLKGHLQNHPVLKAQISKLFNSEVRGVFGQLVRDWSQGTSPEDLVVESAERLGSQAEHILPILEVISQEIGVERNKAGAQFILKVVLENASFQILGTFKEMGPEFISLFLTKSVTTYSVKEEYAVEDLPPFFTKETNEKIKELRKQLLRNSELRAHYLAVSEHLDRIIAEESVEDLFSFKSELPQEQQQALTNLQKIGSGELQSDFIKVSAANAIKRIELVDEEESEGLP